MSALPDYAETEEEPQHSIHTLHTRRAAVKPFRPLTDQQKRVCRLVARGESYKTIAAELRINRYTVRDHVQRIGMLLPSDGLPAKERVQIWAILAGFLDAA